MKTKLLTVGVVQQILARVGVGAAGAILALSLWSAGKLLAEAPPTTLQIAPGPIDSEGLPAFELRWNAVSNATYLVQSATDLAATNPWQTLDIVTPTNNVGVLEIKGHSIPENSAEYFRLVLPQPQIFSVEPAVVTTVGDTAVYVIGQCLSSTGQVSIAGQLFPVTATPTPNVYQFTVSPLAPGVYDVSWVEGGQTVTTSYKLFSVTAEVQPVGVAGTRLDGPPAFEPPASPSNGRSSGHAAEKLEILWETMDLGAGRVAAPSGGGSGGPLAESGRMNFYNTWPSKWNGPSLNARGSGAGGMEDCDDGDPTFTARLMKAKEKANRVRVWDSRSQVWNALRTSGVIPFSGEVQECAVDLVIPGRGLDFIWARTYRSRVNHAATLLGSRWTLSYDVSVEQAATGITVNDGTGRADTFTLQSNGTYTCPEFFYEGSLSNNTFTLIFADTGRWVFNPFDGTASAGKLRQIITRNGDTMTLRYDTGGRLAQIVDDLERTNTLAYDTSGRVASVTDFSGRTVSYQYYQGLPAEPGGAGDLKSVTSPPVTGTPNGNDFPQGKTITYTYTRDFPVSLVAQNHLLLSCVDALGTTVEQFSYDLSSVSSPSYLRCVSQQRWTNAPTMFSYLAQTPSPTNQFATLRCIVNDPVGHVSESFFDARGRCVKEQEFTGRATPGLAVTATVNRPAGKLRAEDPDYFECRSAWNNDSLRTKLIMFGGQQVQCVYESDFDKTTRARKRADLRVVREIASSPVDLDGDGFAETTERVWRYEYDPRFGSPTVYKWRKAVLDGKVDRRSISVIFHNDAGEEAGKILKHLITTPLSRKNPHQGDYLPAHNFKFEVDGFVTSATDPRGNVTTASYDAHGKSVQWEPHKSPGLDSPELQFTYNSFGQLTAITNAADANGYRRVDQINYFTSGPQSGRVQSIVVDEPGLHLNSSFEYDAVGNLTRYIDPRTNDWLFTYNALDQCVRVQTPTNISARCATDFTYDANDNLVATTTELRDAADNLVASPVDRVSYDSRHQLTELALAIDATRAQTNRFVYDGSGQCVQELGPDAVSSADPYQTVTYQYDERGLLFRQVAALGSPVQFTSQLDYDADANPTRISDGLEGTPSVTVAEYDGFVGNAASGGWTGFAAKAIKKGDRLSLVGFGSFTTASRLKVWQLMQGQNATSGRQARFEEAVRTENVRSRLLRAANHRAIALDMRLRADDCDRLSKITDAMGNVTTFHYDANDNLKVVRHFGETNDVPGTNGNVRLAESRYEYDGLDRLFRTHDLFFNPATQAPLGSGDAFSSQVLAPNGDCVSVTDSLGRTTSFGYDTAGRQSSATNSRGSITLTFRDALGNPTAITRTDLPDGGGNPQVFSTSYVYDRLNRCVSASDNVGNTYSCSYDSLGRILVLFNPKEYSVRIGYDLLGNSLGVTNYDGLSPAANIVRTSSATYDTSSRLVTSTDPNGNTTSYAYDSWGRWVNITCPDGTRKQKAWLCASFRTIATDPNGTTVTNIYDLCDRLIHRDIAARGGALATTTFETFAYDGCDRLVLASNDVSQLTFSYNSFGDCTAGSQDGLAQSATYDSEGNPLSLTYPSGRVVSYAYDGLNQITNVSTSANGVSHPQLARFAYAGPGRLARIGRDNGIITRVDWDGLTNPANSAGDYGWQQVSRIRAGTVAAPLLVCDVSSTYSRTQSKLTRADAGRSSRTLTYDPLEQLVQSSVQSSGALPLTTIYEFDAAGNRSHVIINGVLMTPDYASSSALPPGDFFMNRYTTTPFGEQRYDANGNLIARVSSAGSTIYRYDYADRLVEVDALDTLGTISPVAISTYDALGNRISKTTYSGVPATPGTTQYISAIAEYKDGEDGVSHTRPGNHKPGKMTASRVIEERSGPFASLVESYIHKLDDGIELARFTASGEPQFYHADDLGNVLALTDAGGQVLERCAYDEYGVVTFLTRDGAPTGASSSSIGNEYLWKGLRFDAETGLHNSDDGGYYDPLTGRAIRGKVKDIKQDPGAMRAVEGNNPWIGGGSGGVFSKVPRSILKSYFETGDKPTQSQFGALIDSVWRQDFGQVLPSKTR